MYFDLDRRWKFTTHFEEHGRPRPLRDDVRGQDPPEQGVFREKYPLPWGITTTSHRSIAPAGGFHPMSESDVLPPVPLMPHPAMLVWATSSHSVETAWNPTASVSQNCDDLVTLRAFVMAGNPDINEGDSQPAPAMAASPPCFLPESSIQETDMDAAACVWTTDPYRPRAALSRFGSTRGALLAPEDKPAVSHLGTEGPGDAASKSFRGAVLASTHAEGDIRIPTSAVVTRGMFTLRGELMHAFVSYRVATEGMVLLACTLCRGDPLPCCTLVC